jgi:hypothetical protein
MTLANLKTLCRLNVPAAKASRISDTNLTLVINTVVQDINARLKLLNQDEKFNVVAEQYKYNLGDSDETVTRFSKIDKLGLYWNAGSATSPDWRRLTTTTVKWLDKNFPQWRDADSGDPLYYAKRGRYLYLYPTPDTALTDGFHLYFIEGTRAMSSNSHWPFGYDSEIPEYSILTDVIIKGVEVWLKPPVGKKQEGSSAFIEYLNLLEMKRRILSESPDISSDQARKMKLEKVC